MREFNDIDLVIRHFASFAYRFILVIYGILIVSNYYNIFEWYYYLVSTLCYLVIYIILFNKDGWRSLFRLLNDYGFIFFILFGKTLNDLFLFSFILIPIINSPNHTGKKRSLLLYVFAGAAFFGLMGKIENWLQIVPFIVFIVIGISEYQRSKLRQFHDQLLDQIDDFFETKLVNNKPHRVYEEIIRSLNNSGFNRFFKITRIFCFRLFDDKQRLVIVNSSCFIWEYSSNSLDEIQQNFRRQHNFMSDVQFTIDGKVIEHNILIIIPSETEGKNPYVFLLEINPQFLRGLVFLYDGFFITIFKKLLRKLQLDREIWLEKRVQIQQLSKKREFISNAENSVHFIKNKLGSIVNYIQTKDNLLSGNLSNEQITQLESLNLEEFSRMKTATETIRIKTTEILDKSKNPYIYNKIEKHSISQLYSLLYKEINETNIIDRLKLDFTELEKTNSTKKIIKYDIDGFESTFTLITSNLEEHSFGAIIIAICENENEYIIKIQNDFIQKDLNKLDQICQDYNSADYVPLQKRRSYGLEQIKDYLLQMKVNSKMVIDKENLHLIFSIHLKKEHEDSDI